MLSNTTVDQVKNIRDIVAVVSDYVQLKKRGKNYIGLCPFHSEKTPSFTVSPDKEIFHCFGCQESGDHISFIQKIENVGFTDAIRQLAGKFGVEVEEDQKNVRPEDMLRQEIQSLSLNARTFFETALKKSPEVMSYLHKRGLDDNTIAQFHLGYCPGQAKLSQVLNAEPEEKVIPLTGLTYTDDNGQHHLRFKGRLMFPIQDHNGKTAGFSGRVLEGATSQAKYMNSEETRYFTKRRILYGLNLAKSAIKKENSAILMEGFMDVMMAHQFGFKNAIATMGTAVTAEHATQLQRFTNRIYLALDSDQAGLAAMERSYDVLKQQNFQVFVVQFNDKDPADTLLENGAEFFKNCIDNSISIIEFLINRTLTLTPPKRVEDIPDILKKLIPVIQLEKDPIIQKHYIRLLAGRLDVDPEVILEKLKKSVYNVHYKKEYNSKKKSKLIKAEESILYIIATDQSYRQRLTELEDSSWVTPALKALAHEISGLEGVGKPLLDLIKDEEQKTSLARLLIENDLQGAESLDSNWQDCLATLNGQQAKSRIDLIRQELGQLDLTVDHEKANLLLKELQALKKG